MAMRPGGWRRGFTLSLFVGALLSSGACGVREDEFDCENAVARLVQCCPGFNASAVDCTYDSACGPTYPALDVSQSHCILQSSCDGLRSAGVCDRAAMLPASSMPTTPTSICPPGAAPLDEASTPEPTTDAAADLQCVAPSGCAAGQACCVFQGLPCPSCSSPITVVSVCSDTPCPSDAVQLCATASDCPVGRTCVPLAGLAGVSLCAPTDGGGEGPIDAARDASAEATADAVSDVAPEASAEASVEAEASLAGDAGPDAPDGP